MQMTEPEAELHRVKANLASAKSKARAKVKKEPGFDRLPMSVQQQKLKDAEDAVVQRK